MSKLIELWKSDKAYAAKKTAIITFVTLFGVQLLGFFATISSWAGADGADFPSISPLAKGFVSALIAALTGLVNFFVNAGQEKGIVPGKAPSYEPVGTFPPKPE